MVRNQTERKPRLFGRGRQVATINEEFVVEEPKKEVVVENGQITVGENTIAIENWRDLSLEEMKLLKKYLDDLYKNHANTEVKLSSAETKKSKWGNRVTKSDKIIAPKSGLRKSTGIAAAVTVATCLLATTVPYVPMVAAAITIPQYLGIHVAHAVKKLGNMKVKEFEQVISDTTTEKKLQDSKVDEVAELEQETLIAQITAKEKEMAEARRLEALKKAEAARKEAEKKAKDEADRIAKEKEQKAYDRSKKYLDFLTTARFIVGRNFIVEKFLTEKHRNMYMEEVQGRTMEENNKVAEAAREVFKEVGGEKRYTDKKVAKLDENGYKKLVKRIIARQNVKNRLDKEAEERKNQEQTAQDVDSFDSGYII